MPRDEAWTGKSATRKRTLIELDFGMRIAKRTEHTIWFKAYGPDPYVYVVQKGAEPKYLGGTFIVESFADLERYVAIVVTTRNLNRSDILFQSGIAAGVQRHRRTT